MGIKGSIEKQTREKDIVEKDNGFLSREDLMLGEVICSLPGEQTELGKVLCGLGGSDEIVGLRDINGDAIGIDDSADFFVKPYEGD